MDIRVISLLAVAVITLIVLWALKKGGKKWLCSRCGGPAIHGYSKAAESDPKDIVPLCASCLFAQLEKDYSSYSRRAVVIQPVTGLPCYVFRPKREWDEKLQRELDDAFLKLKSTCSSCGGPAHYLWLDCDLQADLVADIPEKGFDQTLPTGDTLPSSLCGTCSVKRIAHTLTAQENGYLEVCGPQGVEDGLVIAMGY